MEVNNLVDSLTTLTGNFLGTDYGVLKFKYDIEANFTQGASKKYGVLAQDITGTSGATCFVTVDQIFEIVLTDSYKAINNGDQSKDEARRRLQDLSLDLYVDILNKKAGLPSVVMNIRDLNSSLDESIEDKLIINTLSFTIQYRKQLGQP